MTNLLQEATQAVRTLHDLCIRMRESQPDVYSLLAVQADIVRLHMELGQELSRKFGVKESSYLGRKIEQAKQYQKARIELKLSGVDSTEAALLAVGEEFSREIEAAQEFESYRTLLRSLQNALDYARTTVSFLKAAESLPATQS